MYSMLATKYGYTAKELVIDTIFENSWDPKTL